MEIKENYSFQELIDIVADLRSENGCPWDKEQTHESLIPCLREESEEVIEAIQKNDLDNLEEELGDVLLQVIMHARIASEQGHFDIHDVITGICQKMVRRHPHVFGDLQENDKEQLLKNWEQIKAEEKKSKTMKNTLK